MKERCNNRHKREITKRPVHELNVTDPFSLNTFVSSFCASRQSNVKSNKQHLKTLPDTTSVWFHKIIYTKFDVFCDFFFSLFLHHPIPAVTAPSTSDVINSLLFSSPPHPRSSSLGLCPEGGSARVPTNVWRHPTERTWKRKKTAMSSVLMHNFKKFFYMYNIWGCN